MVTLINRMHTYNTLPHREPCCVLSGRTQMAATWCVLMGSFDGSGQDMHTHTDGDTLRVARRWTCWLLICSDQWFTTWSLVNGGAAPTELARWVGTQGKHHRNHAECTSQGSFKQNSFFLSFFWGGGQSLRIHDKCHKHCQTFFCCSFIINVIIYIFACYFTITTDSLLDCCFIFTPFSLSVLQKNNQHRSIQYECVFLYDEIIKHFRFSSTFAATYFIEAVQSNSGSRVFMLLKKQTGSYPRKLELKTKVPEVTW